MSDPVPTDPLRCRYTDCADQHPIAVEVDAVTCPRCRTDLGLPPYTDPPFPRPAIPPTEAPSDLARLFADLYARLDTVVGDAEADAAAQGHSVTCSACTSAACCNQLTTTSVPEAYVLAEALLRRPDWRDALPRLRAAALADSTPPLTRRSRFLADVPCGLLDPVTRRCTTYDARPSCCRFHTVVSDPTACDAPRGPDGRPDPRIPAPKTKALNLLELEGAVWELSALVAREVDETPYIQAPVSLTVLCLLAARSYDNAEDAALVTDAARGLPSPEDWMLAHIPSLHAEDRGDENARAVAEQLYAIGKRVFGGEP